METKDQSQKEKVRFSAMFEGLVDVVQHEGKPAYLFKTGAGLSIQEEVFVRGVHYRPPPLVKTPWILPRAEEVLRHFRSQSMAGTKADAQLFDDLRDYLKGISELPSDPYYDLLTAWLFHTYLLEQTLYSPIICLFAIPERGKSRTGKGLIYVAYRGVTVESLREASLIRFSTHWRATLFFDVMELWKKAERHESQDLILHRFEKGTKVARVLHPEWGAHLDTEFFEPFGATVIGTNMNPHHILETRGITINMPETGRTFENDVTPELALPFKERLLAFRARYMDKPLPNVIKPVSGRLGDIIKPLVQVLLLVKADRKEAFLGFIKKLETGRRLEKAETLEAKVLRAVIALRDRIRRGTLTNVEIADKVNEGKHFLSEDGFSYSRIRNKLMAMGFEIVRAGDGAAAIVYNMEYIERLREKFGLPEQQESPTQPEDGTDVSDTSEGSGEYADLPPDKGPF